MVGRRVLLRVEKGPAKPGKTVLEVEHLTVKDGRGVTMVDDVSFAVRAGEIVGIAGVAGNGQSELLEVLAGIRTAAAARIVARRQAARRHRPSSDPARTARALGLAHVPEDRHHMGLVLAFEESENSILGYQGDEAYSNGPFLDSTGDPRRCAREDREIRHPPAGMPV